MGEKLLGFFFVTFKYLPMLCSVGEGTARVTAKVSSKMMLAAPAQQH
jgi:hypothetical protein